MFLYGIVLFAVAAVSSPLKDDYIINNKRFPENFMFGVATSAYQIEGAWNVDGRTPSIWDNMTHMNPDFTPDKSNGDVACLSYYKYKEDIKLLKAMGVKHYRFSLSWSRILPTGYADKINELGVAYYKNLIAELKINDIEPLVTISHWDLPLTLEALGGFLNEDIQWWFQDYARVVFSLFGDDVKYWITFNEPRQTCMGGYGYGYYPPAIHSEGLLEYVCAHNLLRAHARAWHVYNNEFRSTQGGKISIVVDTSAYIPASDNEEDKVAADTKYYFELGWFANPVHYGDYPEIMRTRVDQRSRAEGRSQSRLPVFTDEEKNLLKGTADFFAFNTYSANIVQHMDDPPISYPPSKYQDQGVRDFQPSEWQNSTQPSWFKIVPWCMRGLLKWIKDHYEDPDILISENGLCTDDDEKRIYYIKNYMSYMRDAMELDDVKVFGYTVWSIMDNFEWQLGYTQKYGLYEVDFNDENRTRKARPSAEFYTNVCKTRCLTDECVD
ncbi:myrosinase 1-like [Diorhabda carinulata]|uniref:myrosinase 1-like n=1 Tax=Diorhabda carinulata TaxID=1163345 RepID=UPI0025A04B11|nr:myrosinase 1-like [Diorhabda carinulata]